MKLKILKNEYWYGGAVYDGINQPYSIESHCTLCLRDNQTPNQCMPLLLSSKGRWLWGKQGFTALFNAGVIVCEGEVQLGMARERTLRGAYLNAVERFFPFSGEMPIERFFTAPVYNTWIEYTFHQTQQRVLNYAQGVLDHDFPVGVLMIDDGWSPYYGRWRFDGEKFPQAKQMLDKLHEIGFRVMVWVCPFITPDTLEYRQLAKQRFLVEQNGAPYITRWWNGYSSVLDMTNPATQAWLHSQLDALQTLGVDGFKFDGGDSIYYPEKGDLQCEAWARFGTSYPFNEFRATYKAGGLPLIHRLCDKRPAWDEAGLAALVPDALIAGLTGHPFVCPDMIGGGEYASFLEQEKVDGELFVRWTEAACLMPVMQFSAAPWRVLMPKQLQQVKDALAVRAQFQPYINELIQHCQHTGEPILRPLAYTFPNEPCETVTDTFMLGNDLLVSPLLSRSQGTKSVYFPEGKWDCNGTVLESAGDFMEVDAHHCVCGGLAAARRIY